MNLKRNLVVLRNYLVYKYFDVTGKLALRKLPVDKESKFVVSIASYPKRDYLLTSVFQALSRQTTLPKKWILVLSMEEYSSGLPPHLRRLEKRGLEIIWTSNNTYAVKKLVPVVEKYPELDVITLDDDNIYHIRLIEGMLNEILIRPKAIVGYVGKTLFRDGEKLNILYRKGVPSDRNSESPSIYFLGWGGVYYPSGSLDKRALDLSAIRRIVPGRGSDLWFWAAAVSNNTQQVCLGVPHDINLAIPVPINVYTKPRDTPGIDILEQRFQKAIDYFGIREKLLEVLPEKDS